MLHPQISSNLDVMSYACLTVAHEKARQWSQGRRPPLHAAQRPEPFPFLAPTHFYVMLHLFLKTTELRAKSILTLVTRAIGTHIHKLYKKTASSFPLVTKQHNYVL